MPRSTYLPTRVQPSQEERASSGNESAAGLWHEIDALRRRAETSDALFYSEIGRFRHGKRVYTIPRFFFVGPDPAEEPVRIGIFAAIHGDEPETAFAALKFLQRLLDAPERARGYQIYVYPVCNPSGLEENTRHSRSGADLNREFWKGSREPEVYYIERELGVLLFQGVIALHADNTTPGVYAYVRGATLTQALARPAIEAAEAYLPRANGSVIDGFPAEDALIHGACYDGVLSNPAELKPAPFELIFETPQEQPFDLQVDAAVAALDRVLVEYRPFLAFGQNL
ncbi:MAG: succinylglutamate desuccinylase/aspartoacylase family protein [Verrucomicrobiota bacterium]